MSRAPPDNLPLLTDALAAAEGHVAHASSPELNRPLPDVLQAAEQGGRYTRMEFVARGSMGAVYRAYDTRLERSVALKGLFNAPELHARDAALKEAKILAAIGHPNIIQVYDVIAAPDQVWIVTEWLSGKPLSALAKPVQPAAVAALMAQLFDALSMAHASGILHRDVKPSNLMLGASGRVTLIDFGVAAIAGVSSGETLAGSLRYTSPRILAGEPPDDGCDLHSAALLLIEILTGAQPVPDMAPLPLFHFLNTGLKSRIEALGEGFYPPLVRLALDLLETDVSPLTKIDASAFRAREAQRRCLEILRSLTSFGPERYLMQSLVAGNGPDLTLACQPEVKVHYLDEGKQRIASSSVSVREKSAWIAFLAMPINAETPGTLAGPELMTQGVVGQMRESLPESKTEDSSEPAKMRAKIWSKMRVRSFFKKRVWVPALLSGAAAAFAGWHLTSSAARTQASLTLPLVTLTAEPARQDTLQTPSVVQAPAAPNSTLPVPAPALPVERSAVPSVPTTKPVLHHPKVKVHFIANAWADIFIDGTRQGHLPRAQPFVLRPGPHRVRLSSPHVETLETIVQVADQSSARFVFTLKPLAVLKTLLLRAPGRLFVDGVDQGNVVAGKTLRLTYGTHEVRVDRPLPEQSLRLQVTVDAESPSQITLE